MIERQQQFVAVAGALLGFQQQQFLGGLDARRDHVCLRHPERVDCERQTFDDQFRILVHTIRANYPGGRPRPGPVEIRSPDDFADLCADATLPEAELRVLFERMDAPPLTVEISDLPDGRRALRMGLARACRPPQPPRVA